MCRFKKYIFNWIIIINELYANYVVDRVAKSVEIYEPFDALTEDLPFTSVCSHWGPYFTKRDFNIFKLF